MVKKTYEEKLAEAINKIVDAANEHFEALYERVKAIEQRQRAHKVHDPDCPTFLHEEMQKLSDMWFGEPPQCECWLSEASSV